MTPATASTVLVLSDDPLGAALLGLLVELAGYAPAFAAAGECPEDSVARVRPLFTILLDASLAAARSDVFFANAARRGAGLAVFGRAGTEPEIAAWARDRGIPLFEVPIDAARLADVIRAGALSEWWRAGGDRRRLPEVFREAAGSLVFVDRAGRRWHVFDRRGSDRRQSSSAEASADPPAEERAGLDRVFVDESGHRWRCELRRGETGAAAPLELERQLARSSPDGA